MSELSFIPAINISASGLNAENQRMEVVANNVANAETTKGPDGNIFKRRQVVFAAKLADAMGMGDEASQLRGVQVDGIVEDNRPPRQVYRPGHPDADENGFVNLPNISPVEEMVDMMSSSRSYEANLNALKVARDMANKALEIGK